MLKVRLVKVQLASEVMKGMMENKVLRSTITNKVVNQAPLSPECEQQRKTGQESNYKLPL